MACSLFAPKEHYKMSLLGEYLGQDIVGEALPSEDVLDRDPMKPVMVTLQIDGGKKQKLRPGDIVGALTGKDGIEGKQVGKIHVMDRYAYVAVHKAAAKVALNKLIQGQMKGRNFRARWVGY
jgi:ATP-independent RNA helicase DbpA